MPRRITLRSCGQRSACHSLPWRCVSNGNESFSMPSPRECLSFVESIIFVHTPFAKHPIAGRRGVEAMGARRKSPIKNKRNQNEQQQNKTTNNTRMTSHNPRRPLRQHSCKNRKTRLVANAWPPLLRVTDRATPWWAQHKKDHQRKRNSRSFQTLLSRDPSSRLLLRGRLRTLRHRGCTLVCVIAVGSGRSLCHRCGGFLGFMARLLRLLGHGGIRGRCGRRRWTSWRTLLRWRRRWGVRARGGVSRGRRGSRRSRGRTA